MLLQRKFVRGRSFVANNACFFARTSRVKRVLRELSQIFQNLCLKKLNKPGQEKIKDKRKRSDTKANTRLTKSVD